MGHLCSSLPNFCQASPGHIDASRLVELFCNELSTQNAQHNVSSKAVFDSTRIIKLNDGVSDQRRRTHQRRPPKQQTSADRSQLNWIRVRQASLAVVRSQEILAAMKSLPSDDRKSEDLDEEKKSIMDSDVSDNEATDSSCSTSVVAGEYYFS